LSKSKEFGRVLVTGSQGYIGTEVVNQLILKGVAVTGVDVGYFQDTKLDKNQEVETIRLNLRDVEKLDLTQFASVIHLAALSNDPLGEIDPNVTYEINRDCAITLAKQARKQGVERFIFASTQSIYGISKSAIELDEDAEKNPVTVYAKSKWEAEQEILGLSTNDFLTVSVRPSTVFGWGSRIRNDIIFNNMIMSGLKNSSIDVHTDGKPYRPVVHILDVVDFFLGLLSGHTNKISGKAFNLGLTGGNYTVLQIAEVASACLGNLPIISNTENLVDQRTYKVSFEKARVELGFIAKRDLFFGGNEIVQNFLSLSPENRTKYFNNTSRLAVLKRLINSDLLKHDLSWA